MICRHILFRPRLSLSTRPVRKKSWARVHGLSEPPFVALHAVGLVLSSEPYGVTLSFAQTDL